VATAVAVAGAGAAAAEVAVLVGDPAGRVAKDPDPARMNEPFAVAFDAAGRMYGVEYTRGNRLFRVAADGAVEFIAGRFHVSTPRDAFAPDAATAAADVRFHGLHDVAIDRAGLVGEDGLVAVRPAAAAAAHPANLGRREGTLHVRVRLVP
jgi:hypothetical protein